MLNNEIASGHEINPDNQSMSGSQYIAMKPQPMVGQTVGGPQNMDQEQMFKMFEMFQQM